MKILKLPVLKCFLWLLTFSINIFSLSWLNILIPVHVQGLNMSYDYLPVNQSIK